MRTRPLKPSHGTELCDPIGSAVGDAGGHLDYFNSSQVDLASAGQWASAGESG